MFQKQWLLQCLSSLGKPEGTLCGKHLSLLSTAVCLLHTHYSLCQCEYRQSWKYCACGLCTSSLKINKVSHESRVRLKHDTSTLQRQLPRGSSLFIPHQKRHFKGSSKVRNNNWGSPIIAKANKTPWPTQMWNAGQTSKNVNMASAVSEICTDQTPHTHTQKLDTGLEEAGGVERMGTGPIGPLELAQTCLQFRGMALSSTHVALCYNIKPCCLFCCVRPNPAYL